MTFKITDKIISIPPYISTSWTQIATLHIKGGVLAFTLMDGETIQIPNLSPEIIQLIFRHHAAHLENDQEIDHNLVIPSNSDLHKLKEFMDQEEPSLRFAFGSSIDGMGANIMQHNPSQSDAPELPVEILQKIGAIAKILSPAEEFLLPKGEPGCNCFHCQISRALNPQPNLLISEDSEVKDDELTFQQWSIAKTGDNLYSVVHRLDDHEKYSVYLGHPVGCTCGKEGCEHILAVLKS